MDSPVLPPDPQAFRSKTIGRLEKLIDRQLARLESEGEKISVRDLALQTGILLTKHSELTGVAPPSSVHNQTTVIAGIDQQSARAILSGKRGNSVAQAAGQALVAVRSHRPAADLQEKRFVPVASAVQSLPEVLPMPKPDLYAALKASPTS